MIQHIHLQVLYHLDQIVDPASTTFWNQGWMDAHRLGLRDAQVDAWNVYVNALWSSHLRLTDRPDELILNSALEGIYTPKLGYIQLIDDLQNRDPQWWWKGLRKSKCPQKARIFMWCLIENKAPTWDKMAKRLIEGQG